MNDLLATLDPGLLTPAVLLGIAMLLVLRGGLVPAKVVETIKTEWHARLADKDARLAEKDEAIRRWQDAYENERAARQVSEAQTGELLNLARTTNALLSGLPPARPTE